MLNNNANPTNIASTTDALAQATEMLQRPSRNTKRKILASVNATVIAAVILHIVIQIIQFGKLPDPARDLVLFPLVLLIHAFSLFHNFRSIVKQTDASPRLDRFTAWSSVGILMLLSILFVHNNENTAISLLFDFSLSVITLFIVGTVINRRAAVVWCAISLISLGVAWQNRSADFTYHLMTKQEVTAYKQALNDNNADALQRQEEVKAQKLNPFPIGLYVGIWVIFILFAFLPTFFEAGMIDGMLRAIPNVIDKIQVAADEKHKLQAENARMSMELDVARRIQNMVLPRQTEWESQNNLDIAAQMYAAVEVGGDYYEVLPQKNGDIYIGIGDVTDHGLQSGVIMLMTQTAIRTSIDGKQNTLKDTLQQVNSVLYNNISTRLQDKRNLTLCLLKCSGNEFTYCGQHESILLYKHHERKTQKIDTLDAGMYLGLIDNISPFLAETTIHIDNEDVLVLYTDGVTEAENQQGEMYGLQRLTEVINQTAALSAQQILKAIFDDIFAFINGQIIFDDITVLVAKKRN